jgi:hypothetical protein
MFNPKDIAEGFINSTKAKYGKGDKEVERIAQARYEICLACPFINFESTRCTSCGCILAWKTRSKSKCPKDLWNE